MWGGPFCRERGKGSSDDGLNGSRLVAFQEVVHDWRRGVSVWKVVDRMKTGPSFGLMWSKGRVSSGRSWTTVGG